MKERRGGLVLRNSRIVFVLGLVLAWLATSPVAADDPASPPSDGAAKPKVDLGRLLKLPDSYQRPVESRRGKGQAEWQSRFETVRLDLVSAETALAKAKADLDAAATDSSQWAVAAPGTAPNPENTPLSYKLRQEIRRQRENLKRAERQLRALEIEADLAEVPQSWRATHIGSSTDSRGEISIQGSGEGEAQ